MTKWIAQMARHLEGQSGVSLVATTMTLLMLALFSAVAVTLMTTGSNIAVQEVQGVQAFNIADGGLQYTVRRNNFPNFGVSPAVNLGEGSFTVSVPTLSANINNSVTTINVSSTEGFAMNPGDAVTPYWIMLCDTATNPAPVLTARTANCEKISFSAITPTSFTGAGSTRGRDSSSAATHLQNTVVLMYRWPTTPQTTLNGAHTAITTTINVASTAGFAAPPALIRINSGTENNREDVLYTGMTANSFLNCTRGAYDGGVGIAKAAGATVWQSEISALPLATGIIPGNAISGNIQRKIQITVLTLK